MHLLLDNVVSVERKWHIGTGRFSQCLCVGLSVCVSDSAICGKRFTGSGCHLGW